MPDLPTPFPDADASGIQNPELSKSLVPERRSVPTAADAANIVKRLIEDNRERNLKNARIMAKYNAEAPYRAGELKAEGLDYQSNFSTKPLSMLIEKIAPRFTKALESCRYLTGSQLPDDVEGASAKTEFFRAEITKVIRAHPSYADDMSNVAQENALFGYCAMVNVDSESWWPTFFRQDEFFVPAGAKHTPDSFQVFAAKQSYLPHNLFEQISGGREAADLAGWNVDNVVKAINDAAPVSSNGGYDDTRRYEDLVRESSASMSFTQGAKTIEVYHLFAQEVSGEVTHWILDGKTYDELFHVDDEYESMAEAAAGVFSFQQANGRLHGSKGVGREVYNMAGVLDRARNAVVDRLHLSGKLVFRGDEKLLKRFRMAVVGGAIVYPSSFEIQQAKIDGNVEPFVELDQYMVNLLDQMVGAATPKEFMGERVTKAAVDLYAAREEERRDSTLDRFLRCFANMMTTVQRRLLDPDTRDEAAKQLQQKLLTKLTKEELEYLRKQPAISTVSDYTETENQIVAALSTEHAADPLCNQKELRRRKFTALLGADFADAVLLPDNDPTQTAEQARLQLMENALISLGRQVPVSPRDNHQIHLAVLNQEAAGLAPNVVTDKAARAALAGLVAHATAHIETALQHGAPAKELAEARKQVDAISKQLAELEAAEQQPPPPAGGGAPAPGAELLPTN